jgi:hypothetical protein
VFCGISGLLQHQVNALLLDDPRDAKVLGVCLQTLMADAGLQHALSTHALVFAAQFQWSGIAALQDAVYRSIQPTH